ncbi:hypothetical protein ACFY05_25945 [Microtetraspora fusca]|uniref:Uncharacterized protein n=1 Tax=Microtetraspora fusca TaxID=1997 RepID=A0ABW6VBC7_MICFU
MIRAVVVIMAIGAVAALLAFGFTSGARRASLEGRRTPAGLGAVGQPSPA